MTTDEAILEDEAVDEEVKQPFKPTIKPSAARAAELADKEEGLTTALAMLARAKKGNVSKRRAEEAKRALIDALNDVDDETASRLFADDEFQDIISSVYRKSGGNPGDPLYDEKGREIGRVPLTPEYQMEIYDMVEWTPMKTQVISVNGVDWKVFAGLVNKTPNIVRDVAMEAWRQTNEAMASQRQVLQENGAADGITFEVGWAGKAEITGNTPGWQEK